MSRYASHGESHLVSRIGWLRAAVLGANDGIVSTASLIIGVAASAPQPGAILIAGAAGLVAGAMSMAAGEYVSVSSQSTPSGRTSPGNAANWRPTPKAKSPSWRISTSGVASRPIPRWKWRAS